MGPDQILVLLPTPSLLSHIIEAWRLDYNQRRPHSSLGNLTSNEFVAQRQALQTVEEIVCSG